MLSSTETRPKPLPAFLRSPIRFLLRTWSHFPKAHGYLYYLIETWGSRLATRPLVGQLANGAAMECDLNEHMQRQIYFLGAYEPVETYLFPLLIEPGMVVIDAGAHIGQYSLLAAHQVGPTGAVHAFEPVLRNFERLAQHTQENALSTVIRINKLALWHQTEKLNLHLRAEHAANPGAYTAGRSVEPVDTVTTEAVTLDEYVKENAIRHVDIIKMDIEGAEWFALQGARDVLTRWQPTMLMELNRPACRAFGYGTEMICQFLKGYGYDMWRIGSSSKNSQHISSPPDEDIANVIFHVDSLPESVMNGWSLNSVMAANARRGN